jgi:hypothetical protein
MNLYPGLTADSAPDDSALPRFRHTSRRLELDLAAPGHDIVCKHLGLSAESAISDSASLGSA